MYFIAGVISIQKKFFINDKMLIEL